MAVEYIPDTWRKAVCDILRAQDQARIRLTLRAQADWQTYFGDLWFYELYDGIRSYLSQDSCRGRLVTGMEPPGTVYEFICSVAGRLLYCKINLTPQGDVVIIYSAHPPHKGDEL